MATASAIMDTPAARPPAGESRVTQADRDRDDSFSRMVDAERDDRDAAIEAETTKPAPAPVAEAPEKPDHAEAASEAAAEKNASDKTSAAKAYQAALNELNTDEAAPAADAEAKQVAAAAAQAEAEAAARGAKPATSTAAATTAVTQTNAALLVLANATGVGAGATNGTPTADTESTDETKAADGSEIAALLGITRPTTPQAVPPTASATGEGDATNQAAAAKPGIAAPTPGEVADPAIGNADAGKPVDATAQAAASSQPKAQSPSQAAVQATGSAAPADAAVKVAVDTGVPAPQAATQPSTTSNPLSDASRASATPPALQSAPAATIEVYSRIIERADGRAQRFEVRLDPAELGRVDVRIEIGADKKVHAVLAAHDSAALSDLMRGQRALERALSDAGIDLADNGVRFEMSNDANRGGASQQREGDAGGRSSQSGVWRNFDTALIPVSADTAAAVTPSWRPQRLDLVA